MKTKGQRLFLASGLRPQPHLLEPADLFWGPWALGAVLFLTEKTLHSQAACCFPGRGGFPGIPSRTGLSLAFQAPRELLSHVSVGRANPSGPWSVAFE